MSGKAEPIDIRKQFGRRYRVVSEDGNPRNTDRWLWIIPCRYGHIYLQSADRLGAAINGRRVGEALSRLPGVQIEQAADDGYNLSFPVEAFKAIAAKMRPQRARRLSARERRRLAEAGRPWRFGTGPGETSSAPEAFPVLRRPTGANRAQAAEQAANERQ